MSDGTVVSHNKVGIIVGNHYATFWAKTSDVQKLLSKIRDNANQSKYLDRKLFEFLDSDGLPIMICLDKVSFVTILE